MSHKLSCLGPNDLYYLLPKWARGDYKIKCWKDMEMGDYDEVLDTLQKYKSFFS